MYICIERVVHCKREKARNRAATLGGEGACAPEGEPSAAVVPAATGLSPPADPDAVRPIRFR
jgi:hypothetical protein